MQEKQSSQFAQELQSFSISLTSAPWDKFQPQLPDRSTVRKYIGTFCNLNASAIAKRGATQSYIYYPISITAKVYRK